MKKCLLVFILISIFATVLSISPLASEESRLYDKVGLIDSKSTVSEAIRDFELKCEIPLFVVTTHYTGGFSLSELGLSRSDDVIILEITEDYYYSIYTYGNATARITDSEVDRILDADGVYKSIKSGRLEEGICAFAKEAKVAYLGKLQEPFYVTVAISFLIALIIAGVAMGIIIYKYKRKQKAPAYPLEKYASMIVEPNLCADIFIGSSITRTRVNTSTSRGGGSSGGGGRRGTR